MFNTRKTVDDVLTAFSRAIADLKKVEEDHAEEADRQDRIAKNAAQDRDMALAEAQRAREVGAKLSALTGADLPNLEVA